MDNETKKWIRTLALAVVIALVITMAVKPVIVKGKSMEPTYAEGNWLLLNKVAFILKSPIRNDFVVFTAEDQLTLKTDCIKRIIGVPGDSVNINKGNVYINNELLYEDYIGKEGTTGMVMIKEIPKDYYFVLGDNRAHSLDSRSDQVGLINIEDIKGKIILNLFK